MSDLPARLQPFTDPTRVLDHGFVRLVQVMGDDGSIVETARVTTGKGRSKHVWKGEEGPMERTCGVCGVSEWGTGRGQVCLAGDRNMLRYMFKHHHASPFEFAEVIFHIRVPMDVWRQMIRHRTASVSEYSTRYSPAVDLIAETDPEAWRLQSGSNRQGSNGLVTEWPEGWAWDPRSGHLTDAGGLVKLVTGTETSPGDYLSRRESTFHEQAREVYQERLDFGVAKEQARKDLPLSNYTEAYWKCDLRNLLHFCGLRLDEHAQLEIRQYAQAIAEVVRVWVPMIWEAFEDYERYAKTLSRLDILVLQGVIEDMDEAMGGDIVKGKLRALITEKGAEIGNSGRETKDLLLLLGL